ncbi:hypothetical protein [Streptomyces sp. 4N124]|uniref:hypothetical protein n=1 Tax=Streptomyces sp. 4N124 TaxID=3457420 RepID=UPI003FD085DB
MDLTRPRAGMLTVSVCAGEWQTQLTLRHTELLFALASHPQGRTAAELAEDLFAERHRAGAVRAEFVRLRAGLSGLLASRPYRFRDGVSVRTLGPADPCDLLPDSVAPIVRRARSGAGAVDQ